LVDLLLLIESGTLDTERLRQSIKATFLRRDAHPIPAPLESPPQAWANTFAEMAGKCELTQDLVAAFSRVAKFIGGLGV
jgi:hypothetical protein